MVSLFCGLGAALSWGGAALVLARAARGTTLPQFGLWILVYQTLLLALPAALLAPGEAWSTQGIGAAGLAGALEAVGTLAYGRALQRGEVGIAAALLSLEGAVVAVLAIAGGETVTIVGGAGILLAAAGGVVVGLPREGNWLSTGSGYALGAAVMFGIALWLTAVARLDPFVTLFVINAVAALLVAAVRPEARRERLPYRVHRVLFLAALLGIGGFVLFALGARASSVAVTSVLAAQFSVFAVLGGYFLLDERLSVAKLSGIGVVLIGVSAVAATHS